MQERERTSKSNVRCR